MVLLTMLQEQGTPNKPFSAGQAPPPPASPYHEKQVIQEHTLPMQAAVRRPHSAPSSLHQPEQNASPRLPGLAAETIRALPNLRAETIYHAEITHLPIPAPENLSSLIDRARAGEEQAREELLLSCLPYALGIARFVYHARRPAHDDLLDLAQVASEQMLLRLDRALAANDPAAYLRGIARSAIRQYCTYHADLIQKPEYPLAILKKRDPYPASVVSLDQPLLPDGTLLRRDQIAAPSQQEPEEGSKQQNFAPLYTALEQMSPLQTEVLTRLYGLHGQPRETPEEIGRPKLIHERAYEARKRLRSLLANRVKELLSDQKP